MEGFGDILARNAAESGGRPAIIEGPLALTHAQLLARVSALVAALHGAQRKRLLLLVPNGTALVVAQYATLMADAETLLLDAQLPVAELAAFTERFAPEWLVTVPSAPLAIVRQHAPRLERVLLLPEEGTCDAGDGLVTHVQWADAASTPSGRDYGSLDHVTLVLNTTGTTGARKLVSLTQRNLLAAARNINERMQIGSGAREVCPLPLHRSFGLGRARCLSLVGGTLIIAPPRGDRVLALLRQHQATGLAAVPAFFRMLIQTFGLRLRRYFEGLEYVEIGSAPMALEDKLFLLEAMPRARIYMHYGLTEASRSAFIEFRAERAKLETIGRPTPHVELRIVGEDGTPCPAGQAGEIVVRGEHVCAGYWGDPALTAARFQDGWLRTNDCGNQDADGYVRLAGRMDDVMNVGGIKVSPETIERVVREIEGVADCAAVGTKDPRGVYGEVPFVYIVRDQRPPVSAQLVKSYCARRLLPEEVPHEVVFIDMIPRTDTGKIQRARLRAHAV